ncbi:MAG: hypothetical protein RSD05_13600 [Comamonas sp.]
MAGDISLYVAVQYSSMCPTKGIVIFLIVSRCGDRWAGALLVLQPENFCQGRELVVARSFILLISKKIATSADAALFSNTFVFESKVLQALIAMFL